VIDGIKTVHDHFPDAFISIDTYYSKVASAAVAAGACLVNDISAGVLMPICLKRLQL
jgi:dihydropteroate synthase